MAKKSRKWFWRVRTLLIERYNWSWDKIRDVRFEEISYASDNPQLAAQTIHKDFK